jgi:hypothetical protein
VQTINYQTLAGTRVDSQGERNPKEVLESFAQQYAGKRMPLNQQHDLSLKSPGYVENLRVVPDTASPGDWSLVGDVSFDTGTLQQAMGGFSISFLEVLRRSKSQALFHIYLPFPHYRDEQLLDDLFEEGYSSVGRWAKKAADPTTVGLIGATFIFLLKPVWEDLYKTQIAPHIYEFFKRKFGKLKEKQIDAQVVQYVVYNNFEIQILLLPSRGREQECFAVESTNAAMKLVHEHLTSLPESASPPSKLFLQYDDDSAAFKIHRIEKKDGSLDGPI